MKNPEFEGLLIELTAVDKYPKGFNFLEWKKLGEHYKLDKDNFFDEKYFGEIHSVGEEI